jgi:hypothetical protein
MREVSGELLLGVHPALGFPQDLHRDWGVPLILQEPLVRRRVIRLDEVLMALL